MFVAFAKWCRFLPVCPSVCLSVTTFSTNLNSLTWSVMCATYVRLLQLFHRFQRIEIRNECWRQNHCAYCQLLWERWFWNAIKFLFFCDKIAAKTETKCPALKISCRWNDDARKWIKDRIGWLGIQPHFIRTLCTVGHIWMVISGIECSRILSAFCERSVIFDRWSTVDRILFTSAYAVGHNWIAVDD